MLLSILFGCLLLNVVCPSRIYIKDNGYRNILVALPSNVKPEQRKTVISNTQELFKEASWVLLETTKRRAQFQEVTLLIPHNWGSPVNWISNPNVTVLRNEGGQHRKTDADIILSTSPFGAPFTLHSSGCGYPAVRIHLPKSFLTSGNKKERCVQFIRLWSEFRYGVFPEGGFKNDPLYPLAYTIPGTSEQRVTSCINAPHHYELRDSDGNECAEQADDDCMPIPVIDDYDDRSIISSLMYQQLNPWATSMCEGEWSLGPRHDSSSPSKQNFMCDGEGVWFNALRNPDFLHGNNAALKIINTEELDFHYVQETLTLKIVVVVDVSSTIASRSTYQRVKQAFAKFIITDLPYGSKLGLVLSAPNARVRNFTTLDNYEAKIRYMESMPLPEEAWPDDTTCLECSIITALDMLEGDNSGATIIAITTQHKLYHSFDLLQYLLDDARARLNILVLPFKQNTPDPPNLTELSALCRSTGGSAVAVESFDETLEFLYMGMWSVLQGLPNINILIAQEYLTNEENITFSFPIDQTVSKDVKILVTADDIPIPLQYDVKVLFGGQNLEIELRKDIFIPAWNIDILSPKVGDVTFQARRRSTDPLLISVIAYPPLKVETISLRIWVENVIHFNGTPAPMKIFAELRHGLLPVSEAIATAFVYHPEGGIVSELSLLDDGLGDTDNTKNDGIYSRYFTNFTNPGFYNVVVKVRGFQNQTAVLEGPNEDCCGFEFPSIFDMPTGNFQRIAGPVTFQVPSARESDIYPPNRISDLRLHKAYDRLYVLSWTAAGDDYDFGWAAAYEIKFFPERSQVMRRFSDSSPDIFNVTIISSSPAEYGVTLYHTYQLPPEVPGGRLYYFAVRAIDGNGNAGEISNILSVMTSENEMYNNSIDCSIEVLPIPERWGSANENFPAPFVILLAIMTSIYNTFVLFKIN